MLKESQERVPMTEMIELFELPLHGMENIYLPVNLKLKVSTLVLCCSLMMQPTARKLKRKVS